MPRTPFIVLVMAFVFAMARPLAAAPAIEVSPKEFDVAATRAAAQAGDPRKMGELGAALVMGVGLDKDEPQGVMWLEKAAARNDNQATVMLGMLKLGGHAVAKDPVAGATLVRKAAERAYPPACSMLAQLHLQGTGVPKSEQEAFKWAYRGGVQGDAQGQFLTGVMMATGIGTQADPAEGRRWLRKAADKGHAEAAQALKQLGG